MALRHLPRIERLALERVELPFDHPAAELGRSIAAAGRRVVIGAQVV